MSHNSDMRHRGDTDRVFGLIVCVYCVYAFFFILRTSFVIGGTRYFSLFDDAMISMRYAKNFAIGHGLVWNPGGERVEGFTNPLWTLYMALLHLMPIATTKLSVLVQASSAAFLAANLLVVRKLSLLVSGSSRFVMLTAVLLTAFYLPLNNWGIQGMEVGVLALLLTASVLYAVRSIMASRPSPVTYVLLALAVLTRTDMAVPYVGILVFLTLCLPGRRKSNLILGASMLAVCLLLQTSMRMWYYGDALPNSYYVKLTGYPMLLRWARGLYVTIFFLWRSNYLLLTLVLTLLLARRDNALRLLGWVFALQLLYSIYVGGDAWESWGGANRYVCIAMPAFFVLVGQSLAEAGDFIRRSVASLYPARGRAILAKYGRAGAYVAVASVLLSFNSIYGPSALTEWLLLKRPLHVYDNARMVERAIALREFTTNLATAAVVWDGAIPYFSDRYCISVLGKNDRVVGRMPMRTVPGPEKLVAFYPGHMKWSYAYSFGELKPDVIVQIWLVPEEAEPYLRQYLPVRLRGYLMYLREDSDNIRWDRVRQHCEPDPGQTGP